MDMMLGVELLQLNACRSWFPPTTAWACVEERRPRMERFVGADLGVVRWMTLLALSPPLAGPRRLLNLALLVGVLL